MSKAKNLIADLITENQISFVEIHSHLNEISDRIKEQVSPLYADYGMEIINFFVNSISVPENDPGYIQIRSALAKAKETELLAKGEKAQMDILGYNYQQKRTFDMLDKAAQNEGGGSGVIGAGIGMGMGVGIGNMVGSAVGNAMDSASAALSFLIPLKQDRLIPVRFIVLPAGHFSRREPDSALSVVQK